MSSVKLAILSPSNKNFSETFVNVHKEKIDADVKFYYFNSLPTKLEGYGELIRHDIVSRIRRKFDIGLGPKHFNDTQKALYRSLKVNKIEVVMAEFGTTAADSLEVIKALNIPLVVHFHGFDAHQHDVVERYKTAYLKVFDYASSIVVVSNKMKQMLISLGAPDEKLYYNPCAPSSHFNEIKRKVTNRNSILFVGRLVDKKGVMQLVESFASLARIKEDARLILVGDGVLRDKIVNFTTSLNFDQPIIFKGRLNKNEVKTLMANSFAYSQHSLTAPNGDSEGTPVAIMEAAAAGMPVVSTRHAGIADVLMDGVTGYLVEEHDTQGMGEALTYVVTNQKEAEHVGENARQYMASYLTEQQSINILNRLIQNAVTNG